MRSTWLLGTLLAAGTALAQNRPAAPALIEQALPHTREIVFASRFAGNPDGHWYANFGYYAHDASRKAFGEGGRLYRYDLRSRKLTTLLDDPRGGVRDPQVHYDGHRILFSYRKGGAEQYHLYEINADGTGLRQLTSGDYDDFEPSYLATGEIVFISSRCKRWVNCWLTQVAVMYKCNGDGSGVRPLSSNNEQDNTPWPLADGRVMYTRWEYTDRSQVDYHHLWTSNPDGTNQTVWYGNLHPGTVMIDAKPIPGSRKVVAIFSPGHGRREHEGVVTVVDPRWGPDAQEAARKISKTPTYRDPWAFSEELFLAAAGSSIVLMNGAGATQEVVKLPQSDLDRKLTAHEPRPLAARPRERVIPTRADLAQSTGRLVLSDVYQGRNMAGVRRGEIKKLLVLETLPMPIHYTGGMEPITMGGSFTLERIVGTVPIEADGSAYFELPALRSFFFVALDENDLSVKRMQSFMTVQPGETTSCVGCHEQRESAPPPAGRTLAALGRAPSRIQPIADVPDVFDFPRDIQPILDRRCVSCHDFPHPSGGVVLSGDRGPVYSHSYIHLTFSAQVADGRNRAKSNYPPRALGSSASPLMHKLLARHQGVSATAHEIKMVRLWIESGAPYPGTYAALGSGMIGAYSENQLSHPDAAWPPVRAASAALARRCGSCHGKNAPLPLTPSDDQKLPPWDPLQPRDLRRHFSRHVLYNLTRPEMSPLLLAALARSGGGWGLCRGTVFSTPTDPDYGLVLAGIREAAGKLAEMKRFDMPGFVPRVDWVREMKRFGVLPASHDPAAQVDYYAAERRYWESLWYRPVAR
jgi:mono/diheme cytochrome c family protein